MQPTDTAQAAKRPLVGIAAAVGASTLWGLGTVATDRVLSLGVPPGPFTAVELTSSVTFLLIVGAATGTKLASPRRWWRAGVVGWLEPGAVYLIMNVGLARTSASHGALLGALQPVLIVVIGWAFLREKVPARLWATVGLVLAGTAAVVTANASASGSTLSGDVIVVVGITVASVYVLAASRVVTQLPVLALTLLQQLFAVGMVLPIVAVQVLVQGGIGAGPDNPWVWGYVPLIGIASSALTFWLYLTALGHLSTAAAGQFLALIPLVGFAGAVVLLGEPLGAQALAGAGVVGAALLLVARMEQRLHQEEARGPGPEPIGGAAGPWPG